MRSLKDLQAKGKRKILAYKLQYGIESSTNLKSILEKIILDVGIEFILRESLAIAKKRFS